MSDEKCILIENPVNVDIIGEYIKYLKFCRESCYYLRSLLNELDNTCILEGEKSEAEINKIKNRINQLKEEAKKIISEYEEEDKNNGAGDEDELRQNRDGYTKEVSLSFIVDSLEKSISLKSNIDEVQMKIFKIIIGQLKESIRIIIKDYPELGRKFMLEEKESILNMQLNHSTDEDKMNNYILDVKDKKYKKYFKKEKIKLPIYFNYRDYTYNLNICRKEYKKYSVLLIKYISEVNEAEKMKTINRRNNLQFVFNIIVAIATVIPAIPVLIEILTIIKESYQWVISLIG